VPPATRAFAWWACPCPLPQFQDPAAFAAFLRARGVRFVIVPDDMDRAPWIRAVATGTTTLPGFERHAVLPHEVVLRAMDAGAVRAP
jgi:hypothetical protein